MESKLIQVNNIDLQPETMEWEFRKILGNIESYRTGTPRFIAEIEKSSPGVLKTIVREIQLIISDPNANILSKVLAIRFARDIMILGRQDVINELTKLVPHMLKVCSYRLESDDLNRGETYFYDHPQYVNASPAEKQQIERYGSTYFILNLESMYHWGNWIKADQNGNQSIYSKGLQSLRDRGVHFHNNFNYYKNSDTEKFRNTYKVEFFSEESIDLDSSRHSFSSKTDKSEASNQNKQPENINVLKNNLYDLQSEGAKRYDKLQKFNKNAINLLQKQYSQNIPNGNGKLQKQWLQQYIINYNLLEGNKISYEQFMRRATSETIQIPEKSQIQYTSRQMGDTNNFKKIKSSAKRQMLGKGDNNGNRQQVSAHSPDNHLKSQQEGIQYLKQRYRMQIQALNEKLEQERSQHQMQKNSIIRNCEDRLNNIKMEIGNNNANKNQVFIKENQKLKEKLLELEKSFKVSRSREHETHNLNEAYDQLKVEHENLKKSSRKNEEGAINNTTLELNQKIKRLERQLQNQKNENQIILQKMPNQTQISKKNKQIMNLNDELNIYKNSIREQRQEFNRKYKQLQQKYNDLDTEIRSLRDKNKTLQKKLDLRDIEAIEMGEQVKLFKQLNRQNQSAIKPKSYVNANMPMEGGSMLKVGGASLQPMYSGITEKQLTSYDFKKYEPIRNQILKGDKERFLRFCRCCLKKKDLLLKQNQLEIGMISEPISNNEVKFVIHLTNTSDQQINQIRVRCDANFNEYQIGLETEYIFCLQASEQEKLAVFCRATHSFLNDTYLPIFLIIQYIKNSRPFSTKILIPFVLFKTLEAYKSDNSHELNSRDQISLTFPHSQKILSDTKYLFAFFPSLQETTKNKYECDLLFRETASRYRLGIVLKQDHQMTIMLTPMGHTQINPKQRQILEHDLMSFFELCFRK